MTSKSDPERAWTVEFDDRARRELRKLDAKTQQTILRYLRERIDGADDPIGDYRLICRIEERRLVVLVLQVGHRREVYED